MMIDRFRSLSCLALMAATLALSTAAHAAADEAAVKEAMRLRYPGVPVESVTRTPIPGIYEAFAGGAIYYVDAEVKYLIVSGRMIDGASKSDLTEERLRVLTAIDFEQLPLDSAFQIVLGNGTRKMAYFTDPNCPFCKRLDQTLATMKDVTVYVLLYPILGDDSTRKANAMWCSDDRAGVYLDWMLNGNAPADDVGNCDTPIEAIVAFGKKYAISATPTLFFADGQRVSGAIPAEQIDRLLDGATR